MSGSTSTGSPSSVAASPQLPRLLRELFRTLAWHGDTTALSHAVLEAFRQAHLPLDVTLRGDFWIVTSGETQVAHPILYEALAAVVRGLATQEFTPHADPRPLHDGGSDLPDRGDQAPDL